ncbi:MAG: cupin domain-containing protein, partial [Pseudomonadales bacterium]|nr:cupin domain-containing protein [Pseudomonadales bacterium]
MDINADLDRTVYQDAAEFVWQPSPQPGVERVMLDRVGDEVAVATSIVRYAAGATFLSHSHAL